MSVLQVKVSQQPYINDADCPRKPELAIHRQCLKKCRTDLDCRGRNRQCLCDDVCGKACVKPSQRCETLKPIFNGRYEIEPFNIFGARAKYTCNKDYILSGDPERVCQGDGYWSGISPKCEEEGNMADTALVPTLGKCRNPPEVGHALHDGPRGQLVYPLGTQLNYKCEDGYNIDGFFRSMCVGDGRWVGPRMTCSPRRCGHPGDVDHARREGNAFVYPNRVKYICKEGYEMLGRSFRVCMANGQWSGALPTCIPTKCPRLSSPTNGEMIGTDNTYGATVRFQCHKGFEMRGDKVRKCEESGRWSGSDVQCIQVDCGQPGPFYNGYLDGGSTTYGSEYKFRCYGRTTFEGPSIYTTCLENGQWSHPVPKCWKKCLIPTVHNGTVYKDENGDDYATHGDTLNVTCNEGHVINTTASAQCYNGTWTFIPQCVPASCISRPGKIREGFVRFYTMNHGDRAKYKCNTGYTLVGDEYVTCQYGKWQGPKPRCEPVYCPYPGTIENGIILLVGVIGKYEYRSYVKRTEHNQEIQYHCSKQFKRIGPAAATCVDGQWSPRQLPKCVPEQHPKLLYLFRGKRSINGATEAEAGDRIVLYGKQEWSKDKGFCEIPYIRNSVSMNYPSGYYAPHGSVLVVACQVDYDLVSTLGEYRCQDGVWSDDIEAQSKMTSMNDNVNNPEPSNKKGIPRIDDVSKNHYRLYAHVHGPPEVDPVPIRHESHRRRS
ncbi:hypothetical protein LSH36_21g11019 [Paralvinella palmiformis]|uniref:Uncharacterized protein n=1 Tax=Paralvinella palmiformis TaxID=53620 RepID=A0AAD9KCB7_9ANNE|nr:hypothetical protein LSH36_21g11019 [Paralvinella palmiformis]